MFKGTRTKHPELSASTYSHLADCGDTVYLAGLIAQDSPRWRGRHGTIEEETAACLEMAAMLLEETGLTLANAVAVVIHMTDLSDFERMNAVYARFFHDGAEPVRTCVGVAKLLENAKIEITITAQR